MKLLFDLFPVILFFIVFKLYGIFAATASAIIATIVQIIWTRLKHGKIEPMLWVSFIIIVVFGGATLLLQDETFIKWKPTILYWFFASALLFAKIFFGKNLIRALMQKTMKLPERIWSHLNLAWSLFFTLLGLLNLYIAFNFSTDAWVNFKLFGATALMLVFILLQALMISKYIEEEKEGN